MASTVLAPGSLERHTLDLLSGTGYDPFGTVEGAPSPVFEWGYRTQAHYGQLLYLRNRDYDPSTGTFTSPDPVDATPGSVTETNAYDYVQNDPVDRTDVLGLSPDDCNSSFGGVVGAIANWGCHHYDGLHDFLDTTAKVSSMAAATLACAATCFEATAGVAFEASEGSTIVEEGAEEATLEGGETIDPDTVDPPDQTEPGTPDGQPESPTTPDTPDGGSEPGGDTGGDTGGDSPQCANSFRADTPVVMADGTTKAISDIHPGDRVEATDPNTGRTRARTVTAVMSHDDTDLTDITIIDGHGHHGVVHATAHHLLWDATVHAWVQATQLHQGHHLHSLDRTTPQVATTVAIQGHHPMWDLTINTDHDFYIQTGSTTSTEMLVHNCNDYSVDSLSKSGELPDKNGLTRAGRAYQKHMARGELPNVSGTDLNETGQSLLNSILRNPASRSEGISSGNFAGGIRYIGPDGVGATFSSDGIFQYFGIGY